MLLNPPEVEVVGWLYHKGQTKATLFSDAVCVAQMPYLVETRFRQTHAVVAEKSGFVRIFSSILIVSVCSRLPVAAWLCRGETCEQRLGKRPGVIACRVKLPICRHFVGALPTPYIHISVQQDLDSGESSLRHFHRLARCTHVSVKDQCFGLWATHVGHSHVTVHPKQLHAFVTAGTYPW